MTRKKLALLFASALTLLYSYEVVSTVLSGSDLKIVTLLGLGFALGLLVIELRTVEMENPH